MESMLTLGDKELASLHYLRDYAPSRPVDALYLPVLVSTLEGKAKHMKQMTEQCIDLPPAYVVVYSIEIGHPVGTCRHLSVCLQRNGALPSRQAVWMIAQELGFTGALEDCKVWVEQLRQGPAINVMQPLSGEKIG